MSLQGIDIASYQTGIDLSVVPCDFVIVKATEGVNYTNPDFTRAYTQAKEQNKLIGIYHYANGAGATAEADYFLSVVGDRVGDAILVLDWEQGGNSAFGNVSYAKQWLAHVYSKTKVRPLIYMSKSVTYGYDWSAVAPNHGLWVAQYADTNPTNYQSNPWTDTNGYGAWSNGPVIFQYSSTGRLSGWSGNLDLNLAYMDATAWAKYAQGDNYVAPETPDTPTANEAEIRKVIAEIEAEDTYNTLDELPFGRDIVAKLIEKGLIAGVDDAGNLGISYDLLRTLVINYRAGLYDN